MKSTKTNVDNELIFEIYKEANLTPSYLTFMATAGVLAAVAMLADSVPILIGAMVVAPVFMPLSLVPFALAGGQAKMALRGLGTTLLGLLVAIVATIFVTWLMSATGILAEDMTLVQKPLLEERLRPGWYSLIAAAAAGISGGVSVVKNKTDTLIGTVAAVALVPAASAAGIATYAGDYSRALGGFLLLAINLITIMAMELAVIASMQPKADERKKSAS